MKRLFLSLAAIATLTMVSCSKDEETGQITPTKENLTGTYVITGVTVKSGASPEINVFNNADPNMNEYEACERDDQYKLNADLTHEWIDAGTQCSPAGGGLGTWSLVNASTINLDGFEATIASWDGKTLMVQHTDMGVTYKTTFVKQ
jgi:hypothetical protein